MLYGALPTLRLLHIICDKIWENLLKEQKKIDLRIFSNFEWRRRSKKIDKGDLLHSIRSKLPKIWRSIFSLLRMIFSYLVTYFVATDRPTGAHGDEFWSPEISFWEKSSKQRERGRDVSTDRMMFARPSLGTYGISNW